MATNGQITIKDGISRQTTTQQVSVEIEVVGYLLGIGSFFIASVTLGSKGHSSVISATRMSPHLRYPG